MAASLDDYTQIVRLYVSVLDRVPDSDGLKYWAEALAGGMPLQNIVRDFLQTPEAQATYPDEALTDDFVASFYQAVFNREPDAAGLQFWTDALWANGGVGSYEARAFIVSSLIDAVSTPLPSRPENMSLDAYAQTLIDREVFANKVEVGLFFGLERETSFEQTSGILDGVDETQASVDAAKALGNETPEPNPEPNPNPNPNPDTVIVAGKTYTLAEIEALPHGRLLGTSGQDTLNLTDVTHTPGAELTRGIENIMLSNVAMEAVIDAGQSFQGAQFVSVSKGALPENPEDLESLMLGAILTGMAGKTVGVHGSLDVSDIELLDTAFTGSGMALYAHLTVVLAEMGNTQTDMSIRVDDAFAAVVPIGEQIERVNLSGNGVALLPLGMSFEMPEGSEGSEIPLPPGFPFPEMPSIAEVNQVNLTVLAGDRLILLPMSALLGAASPDIPVSIDASANNGEVMVLVGDGMSYIGGAGRDVVGLLAGETGLLDGGAGDEDVLLVLTDPYDFSAREHRGFEVVSIASGSGGTYDVAGFSVLNVAPGEGMVGFVNVDQGARLEIDRALDYSNQLTYELADASGTDDTLDLVLGENAVRTSLLANDIEHLQIQSNTVSGNTTGLRLDMSTLGTITASGTGFHLTGVTTPLLQTVDATGLIGDEGLTFVSDSNEPGKALTVKGSLVGHNVLGTGSTDDILIGGAGDDRLSSGSGMDVLTGNGGNNTFIMSKNAVHSTYTTITDFGAGDRLGLVRLVDGTSFGQPLGSVQTVDAGSFEAMLDSLKSSVFVTPQWPAVAMAEYDDAIWVLVAAATRSGGAPTFIDGVDQVVKLEGDFEGGMFKLDGFELYFDPFLPD